MAFLSTCSRLMRSALLAAALLSMSTAHALDPGAAQALRQKYAELKPQLSNNQYGQPLFLESTEAPSQLKGEAYALLDYPLEKVAAALRTQEQWCDVLILHRSMVGLASRSTSARRTRSRWTRPTGLTSPTTPRPRRTSWISG